MLLALLINHLLSRPTYVQTFLTKVDDDDNDGDDDDDGDGYDDDDDDGFKLFQVVPGSPAGSIGLQPGDVITKIFNRQTKFLTHQQAADVNGAVKNDTLTLTVER